MLSISLGEDGVRQEVLLNAGDSMQVVADVRDSDGNRVGSPLISWQVSPDAGILNDEGIFTAGTKAGTYASGIQVNVVHDGERASATLDVSIEPGPVAKIEIEPSDVVIQPGESAAMTALATDEYGNPLADELLFLWESEDGISVDQTGTVTAGEQGGRYQVSARASYQGSQRTASATVSVPPVWVSVSEKYAKLLTDVGLLDGPSATLLTNGKVLVMGTSAPALLYDPGTRTFENAGSHLCNHVHSQATLLLDGSVLITGGDNTRCAQVYYPESGTFSEVGETKAEHSKHTSTLLDNGRVLIAGGQIKQGNDWVTQAVAEIYDPATGTFSVTSSLNVERKLMPLP